MRAATVALVLAVALATSASTASAGASAPFGSAQPGGAPFGSAQKPAAKEPAQDSPKPKADSEPEAKTGPARVQLGEPIQPNQLQTRDGGQIAADPRARYRTVVKMMITVERTHRERVTRLEMLRALFTESGATESVAAVDRLAAIELAKYDAAMSGYERGLGASLYAQVRAVIDTRGGTPSSAVAPTVAPTVAPIAAPTDPAPGGKRLRRH